MSGEAPLLLVVEDDLDVSDGMVSLLEDEGYRVLAALDGHEGLKRLQDSPDVRLVLLDLTMPKMSAGEFRVEQRKVASIAAIPVLLMSAGLDAARQADKLGAVGFLGKPFKPAMLVETVGRLLGSRA